MARTQKLFAEWLKAERPRFFLWLPVCLGAGMALYYAWPHEPPKALYIAPLLLVLVFPFRHRIPALISLTVLAVLLAATGASYAKLRTSHIESQMLAAPLPIKSVEGTITGIDRIAKGLRITLSDIKVDGLDPKDTPQNVRVSYRAKTPPDIALGERINLRAALLPPSGPVMPGAFDFSRYFFFRHIGAVGYAIPPITQVSPAAIHGFFAYWREKRNALTADIQKTLPGVNGTIASGLITGDDAAIPDDAYNDLKAANLLHVIAISGAHMVVIGGIVFVALRSLLILIPHFGLRPIVKSLSAFLTLVAITFYLAITAFEISATRAYIMLALILSAVILQREPRPMRSIALAALLMMIIDPSDVIEPGFQLSFAATLALIAYFENSLREPLIGNSRLIKWLRVIGLVCMTSVVAELAVFPIILFQFNNLSIYGIISNLVLTPVVAVILMPMVAAYFALLPLGLEHIALHIMNYGIDAMMWVAHKVASWPYALMYLPSPTNIGIALIALGLCWLCLWRTRIRRFGALAMVIGTATLFTTTTPQLFMSPRAAQVALATEKGFVLLRGKTDGLFPSMWANGMGMESLVSYHDAGDLKEAHCDKGFCDVTKQGVPMHFSFTVPDIKKGCPKDGWWISGYSFFPEERTKCPKEVQFLDRSDFDTNGAYWGWFTSSGLKLQNTRDVAGDRIWSKPVPVLDAESE